MKRLVMLRHGESVWNKENRFTGWTNVDLSEKGVEEAHKAGQLLRAEGFRFAKAYLIPQTCHQNAKCGPRRDGFGLDPRREDLDPQRKALWCLAGAEQSRNGRKVWR